MPDFESLETSSIIKRNPDPTRRPGGFVDDLVDRSHARNRKRREAVHEGTGEFLNTGDADSYESDHPAYDNSSGDGVTLNLVGVTIPQAAETILGDLLGLNYVVDPSLDGKITVQTTKPIQLRIVADIFDAALRANGAAIVDTGSGVFRVVPVDQAKVAMPNILTRPADHRGRAIGVGIQVIPLTYVSVNEMRRLLDPIAPPGSILLADETRNLLMLAGSRKELAALLEMVDLFDVDWMKGMSFALVPLESSDPDVISQELTTVFTANQTTGSNTIVRFLPNKRLRSILIISSRPQYVRRARAWIKQLDKAAEGSERQLHVYHVQNRTATELASLLQGVFATKKASTRRPAAEDEAVLGDYNPDPAVEDDATLPPHLPDSELDVRVVADESNNAILIMATPQEFARIRKMLTQLDTIQTQVLLEATIAEVTLNDELRFGLRWFLQRKDSSFTFTDAATGAIASVFPGFSYVLAAKNANVVINAVSEVTDVNVISSPSLMVLDNKTATLQVGDQVPVATQSVVTVNDPDAPIVNSIEFRDTGVILSVTPRVSDSGRVILEIEQEVSDVVETTTSGIDSPTIQQRKVKTTVVIRDGDSLALGGLIKKQHEDGRTKVPVLGDIPLVGTAFREKVDAQKRTELLILITPHVVRDFDEAREVTDEFRKQMTVTVPRIRKGKQPPEAEVRRIVD